MALKITNIYRIPDYDHAPLCILPILNALTPYGLQSGQLSRLLRSPTEVRCNVRHVCFYAHFGQAVDATRGLSRAITGLSSDCEVCHRSPF
jgi:hypothetical protein